MSANTDKQPIDRETKIMFLTALARGYFEKSDLELMAQKYEGLRYDNEELHGDIPVHDWILWRMKENAKTEQSV